MIVYLYLLCTHAPTTFQPNPIRPFLKQKCMFRPILRRSGNKRLEDFRFCFGSKVPNLGGCMLMLGHLGPSSIHCSLSRGLGHRKGIDETTENVQRELQDKLLAT